MNIYVFCTNFYRSMGSLCFASLISFELNAKLFWIEFQMPGNLSVARQLNIHKISIFDLFSSKKKRRNCNKIFRYLQKRTKWEPQQRLGVSGDCCCFYFSRYSRATKFYLLMNIRYQLVLTRVKYIRAFKYIRTRYQVVELDFHNSCVSAINDNRSLFFRWTCFILSLRNRKKNFFLKTKFVILPVVCVCGNDRF